MTDAINLLEAHLLGEGDWLAADTLCRLCNLNLDVVAELVDLGVVVTRGYRREEWQLPASALPRLRVAGRLMHDLGVNVSGAALAIQLLEEQHRLERRLLELEHYARAEHG
jgi:chaperone modulatory protein CbpM